MSNESSNKSKNGQIEITAKAVEEIQKIRDQNNIPTTHGLRLGVKSGGCCGPSYLLGFEENVNETDSVFETNGLKVIVDNNSIHFLAGAQLNFVENEYGSGFAFQNVKNLDQLNGGHCENGSCGS